ncbi:MAG: SGNH/GDSL hydrolase family protein [Clostridia bacterium]|nr:SGNH/GDSL hydrolase family protein [Clostridia bacterium]
MDIKNMFLDTEKPLDNLVADGGFCSIFRTIGCIGDSLSSGEFEVLKEDGSRSYHDMYEYSWGQFIARAAGVKVYNFSRGGMTAKEYMDCFAEANDFWNKDKICQAYIIALGVNDILNQNQDLGTAEDIDEDYRNNKNTFAGYYGAIVGRLKKLQPNAKFFFMTMLKSGEENHDSKVNAHAELLYDMAKKFSNSYVLDFRKYAPVYDDFFRSKFFLHGHLNPCGYVLTAKMVMSYIDYIIRHNINDFDNIGFVSGR